MSKPASARADVNRANAALSTGPRTEEGKSTSSKNSFKHGLTGTTFSLLPSEDATVFAQLVEDLTAEYAPQSTEENLLLEKIARQHWLSLRATNVQTTCFNDDGSLNEHRLSLSIRYLNAHERILSDSRAELRRVQTARRRRETEHMMRERAEAQAKAREQAEQAAETAIEAEQNKSETKKPGFVWSCEYTARRAENMYAEVMAEEAALLAKLGLR